MSTLRRVEIDVDEDEGMVTASWSDGRTGAAIGLTASRQLIESGDLGNVTRGLVEDFLQAVDDRTDWER